MLRLRSATNVDNGSWILELGSWDRQARGKGCMLAGLPSPDIGSNNWQLEAVN